MQPLGQGGFSCGLRQLDAARCSIVQVGDGQPARSRTKLRAVKNLCIGSLIEAVRDRVKTVDLKQVNAVLLQPHWRHNQTGEPAEPVLIPPANLPPRS